MKKTFLVKMTDSKYGRKPQLESVSGKHRLMLEEYFTGEFALGH
nr:hypothetical protein [Streptococcus sp. S784/96/1]